MQLELIGCTSAGKTTLAKNMLSKCDERHTDVVMSDDYVLSKVRLNWIKSPLVRTLLLDLLTLSTCLATWRSNLQFLKFTLQIVRQLPRTVSHYEKLGIITGTFKNVGMYEFIRRRDSRQELILLDEGTLHSAHYLFVHTSVSPRTDLLSSFLRLVPLPDGVIYLRQDVAVLVERTKCRGHKRIPDGSVANIELFINNAVQTFEQLVQHVEEREGLLLMEIEQDKIISQNGQGQSLTNDIVDIVKAAVNGGKSNDQDTQTPVPMPQLNDGETLLLVGTLLEEIVRSGIAYCHWKSNFTLAQSLSGELDLDLLMGRTSLANFLPFLMHLGFKRAVDKREPETPGISHYYGLDPQTAQLVHVHLFDRVLTGESFVKSHLLPFDLMLLENVINQGIVRVPSRSAELLLFIVRTFIKYGSLLDLKTLSRSSDEVTLELRWLLASSDLSEALRLLEKHCPMLDGRLFMECIETLNSSASLAKRILMALRVRRRIRIYAVRGTLARFWSYSQLLWGEFWRRIQGNRRGRILDSGGALIAFVGAEATGKSTLVSACERWLGDVFAVRAIHAGKPPSSLLTVPVNLFLPLARRVLPHLRTTRLEGFDAAKSSAQTSDTPKGLSSLIVALGAVVLAWDRRQLLIKARRQAAVGEIIICDRYPSDIVGAMDSPRLKQSSLAHGTATVIYNALVEIERRLYEQIPAPDLVIMLEVSVETAIKRNRARNKAGKETDRYIESRHRQFQQWHKFGTKHIYRLDTAQPQNQTILEARKVIWEAL